MTETALPDLKLVGKAASSGGRFGNVRITGEAELTGDTECRKMSCVGTLRLNGNLRTRELRLIGECRVGGSLDATGINGTGEISVAGGIRGESVRLTGSVRVAGNLEAESIRLRGALNADGLVSADRLEIRMRGPSRIKEVGGGSVVVKQGRVAAVKRMFLGGVQESLTAELVEGDQLHLEYTQAEVVRGNRISIGPGCRIGRVEFREQLNVSRNAAVRERVRL